MGRRATAARPPKARPGARVSQNFASRAILVFPKTSPAPRVPAVPPREPPLEPRPAGTVPECVPPWLATRTRRGQSSRRERVARRRRMRRGGCGYKAPLRRSEVGRRPSRVRSDMPHAPRKRGWQAPLARPARDATPPSYLYSTNEKVKRSYRPGGQGRRAGGRAGSGETIPSGVSPPDPPSERPTPYPGSEHSWFTGQSGDPLGGGPSHDCPVGPGMAVASHSGAE